MPEYAIGVHWQITNGRLSRVVRMLLMSPLPLTFACCSFLLTTTCLHAGQWCGNLQKDSAAYYACESLNQQERFEQERTKRADRAQSREKQEEIQIQAELLLIVGGVEAAKTALDAGKCDQAQGSLDFIQPKIKNAKFSYSLGEVVLTREDLENGFVALQSKVYLTCLTGDERNIKLLGYLEQEARKGNKTAKEFLVEVQSNAGRKSGTNTNVPKFSDYGTDMASVVKYVADLDETSIEACREA